MDNIFQGKRGVLHQASDLEVKSFKSEYLMQVLAVLHQ